MNEGRLRPEGLSSSGRTRPGARSSTVDGTAYAGAELESRAEDRAERRLFWREVAIVAVLAALVVLRTLVV